MINFTEIYQMVFMVVVGVVMTTTMFMNDVVYDGGLNDTYRRTIES